jgi:hypothetical protein
VDFHRPAANRTDVYELVDDRSIYFLFVAHQHEPVSATQRTDGSGVDNDDHIGLYLWPGGANGFRYFFEANPLGARYQESSENQSYSPNWTAVAHKIADGYAVGVRIPLDAIRGDGRPVWRLQLDRYVSATQEQNVWAFAPEQRNEGQVEYAGYMTGMQFAAAITKPKPRLGIYGLGRAGSRAAGGSALKSGIDAALPITGGASFVGTMYPDYSNVELDQQTISPTEFQRAYQEWRPFFVQGAKFYNRFITVDDSPNIMLYTPDIPTPRTGYAFEGYQGNFGFGTFTSIGSGRDDNAQAVSWANETQTLNASVQRVASYSRGFADVTNGASVQYDNQRTGYAYLDYAQEEGTGVPDRTQAQWAEIGAAYRVPETQIGVALRSIGEYYQPIDGYTQQPGISGFVATGHHFFTFSPDAPLLGLSVDGTYDRYHDRLGQVDQADNAFSASATTRNLFGASVYVGSHQLLLPNGNLVFFNQNGVTLGYLQSTITPANITFEGGRFGNGYLHSLLSNMVLALPGHHLLGLEADRTTYRSDGGELLTQWLERASLSWQIDSSSSFTMGVRRIIGTAPPYPSPSPTLFATNVSAAYHRLLAHGEVYLVYGDPNTLSTTPAAIFKYIFYLGSTKGT